MSRSLSGRDCSASEVLHARVRKLQTRNWSRRSSSGAQHQPDPDRLGPFVPAGFAAGPNGTIYVSNWSIAPANSGGGPTGQVIRITP
jgi:hypothetical protein